eukprot:gene30786-40082_t
MIIADCLLDTIQAVLYKQDNSRGIKTKFVKKEKIQKFVLYLLLVYSEYRSCYLVDYLQLSSITVVVDIVVAICVHFDLRRERFTLFLLGDDVAIANSDVLRRKLDAQYYRSGESWVLLELSAQQADVASEAAQNAAIQSLLTSMARGFVRDAQGFDVHHIPHDAGQLPFIAGWLLGYACIYKIAPSSDPQEDASLNLGDALIQFSIVAELEKCSIEHTGHKTTEKEVPRKSGTMRDEELLIDLMEFTIPQAPLPLRGDYSGTSLEEFVRLQVDGLVAELRSRIHATGGVLIPVLRLRTVSLSKNVHAIAQKMFL